MNRFFVLLSLALLPLIAQAKDVVIDVRTAGEYAGGHIEGAVNIPHDSIAQKIAQAGVGKDDRIVLYCQSGRRSGLALETLKGMGFSKAENAGGIEQARKVLNKP
jgi:phage shock protein E